MSAVNVPFDFFCGDVPKVALAPIQFLHLGGISIKTPNEVAAFCKP
jgi:hypothetical protein